MTGPRAILALTTACLVLLVAGALLLGAPPADTALREAILSAATPPIVALMRVANYGGTWVVLVPGMLALFALSRRARERWWAWVALMIAAPMTEVALKWLVARPRPEQTSFGFPSGHATAAAAFLGAVIYLAGGLPAAPRALVRALAALGIVLVGLARVVLRAHWPSDVLAGIALGLALAAAAALVATRPPLGTT